MNLLSIVRHIWDCRCPDTGSPARFPASGYIIIIGDAVDLTGLVMYRFDFSLIYRGKAQDRVQPSLPLDEKMYGMIKKYILVTKPGIVSGNLITAAAGYFLAAKGRADLNMLLVYAIGISLVVASGCTFNNCADRNLDRKMIRTRDRVLPKGLMTLKSALFYAALLEAAGMTILLATANLLTVAIVSAGFVIYAGVYSLLLKRHSSYAAWIGSLAGAAPPLAGYCSFSNRFDAGAWILLLIFSLWQIPHAYAITIFRLDDYTAAAIPVPPVQHGSTTVKKHIIGYILAFLAVSTMPTFCGYTGYSYLTVTSLMGMIWLVMAVSGCKSSDDRLWSKRLFVFSILTIFVLSVMMSIDFTVPDASGCSTNESLDTQGSRPIFNLQAANHSG